MSEDRTLAPTQRRRQQAREMGQVAHSPELTAAVGLMAAVLLLGFWGGALMQALLGLVREGFSPDAGKAWGVEEFAEAVRGALLRVAGPLLGIVGGTMVSVIAAHQAQTRGLWVPDRLAPDLSRLWSGWSGVGGALARSVVGLLKALVVMVMLVLVVGSSVDRLAGLSAREGAVLNEEAWSVLLMMVLKLAAVAVAVGGLEYAWRWRMLERALLMTAQEQREDLEELEGDGALRAQRRQITARWRKDGTEVLAGSHLVVTDGSNVSIVLAGEGPPGKVVVRHVSRGLAGRKLAQSARGMKMQVAVSPELTRHFARGRSGGAQLPEELAKVLGALWPKRSEESGEGD